jgi:hypothetical protein
MAVFQELDQIEGSKELEKDKITEAMGEVLGLGPLWAGAVVTAAQGVHDMAVKRRLFAICMETQRMCKDNVGSTAIVDAHQLQLSALNWPSSLSRYVLFRNGVEIGGEKPIYEFDVVRPSDMTTARIRLTSEQLDKRPDVRRIIREQLHFNPKLPPLEKWEDCVNALVINTTRMEMPVAARRDNPFLYWLQEWYKSATPAETTDDLVNGYVVKGDFIYIQPHRVQKWLFEHAKINKSLTDIWAILQGYGAKRDAAIRLKDKTRRLWGLPIDVLNPKEDEQEQMPLPGETENDTENGDETSKFDEYKDED